jgi:hypothetical protein
MRSSTFLTILGAGLAIASPIVRKDLVTEVVTDVVYVYVTETAATTSTPAYTTVSSSKAGCQSLSRHTLSNSLFLSTVISFCDSRTKLLAIVTLLPLAPNIVYDMHSCLTGHHFGGYPHPGPS